MTTMVEDLKDFIVVTTEDESKYNDNN